MSAVPISAPLFTVIDPSTGLPAVGAKVYFYIAGTTTPQDTWADSGKLSTNTNPVILDAAGSALVFIDGSYKIVINRSNDTLIKEIDGVYGHGGNVVVSDGDYGDVIISMSGTVYTIDPALLSAFGRTLTAAASAVAARVVLGLVIGTNVQAYDAGLQSFSALPTAADKMPYSTAADVWAELTTTAYGRSLLALADAIGLTAAVNVMGGDLGSGGLAGLVPAQVAGDAAKFLRGDKTWVTPDPGGWTFIAKDRELADATSISVTGLSAYRHIRCIFIFETSNTAASRTVAVAGRVSAGTYRDFGTIHTTDASAALHIIMGEFTITNFNGTEEFKILTSSIGSLQGTLDNTSAMAGPTTTQTNISGAAAYQEVWDDIRITAPIEGSVSNERGDFYFFGML